MRVAKRWQKCKQMIATRDDIPWQCDKIAEVKAKDTHKS
jgi:hypothetical protein